MKRDDAHELMPREVAERVPALYGQEHERDPMVYVKWFTPDGGYTFYITEYSETAPDGARRLAFGVTEAYGEREMGYLSLDELQTTRGGYGLHVERDLYFTPCRLSEVRGE